MDATETHALPRELAESLAAHGINDDESIADDNESDENDGDECCFGCS